MNNLWYAALRKFTPKEDKKGWDSYIEFSKIPQLKEVISLDTILCPNLVDEPTAEDWKHLVGEDGLDFYFRDLDYLIHRIGNKPFAVILALLRSPAESCRSLLNDSRFDFLGYDLLDADNCNSALVNCGGFPDIFLNDELSEVGLITDFHRANEIKKMLKEKYPEEPHANCNVWALWKMK